MSRMMLHRYAVGVAIATGLLVFAGGLVTSTGSGLAVPDWPLSYGELMPPMVGNVRFEHGHRMVASTVGFLTVILALWAWRREPRRAVRRLAYAALAAVIVQGTLGGLTVLFFLPAPISVAHATLAQTFFCMIVAFALVTSPGWLRREPAQIEAGAGVALRTLATVTTGVVYVQLIVGAVMRHIEAGLAIPDFPLAMGRLVPPFDSPGIAVHFSHRLGALAVAVAAAWTVGRVLRRHRDVASLRNPALVLAGLVLVQIALGATTVWTRKAVLPTTFHVLCGALILVTSLVLTLRVRRAFPAQRRVAVPFAMPEVAT
jgi:cytochrome c oxidase assembly protein subunit 15